METVSTSSDIQLDREEAQNPQIHALPLAVLALSMVYRLNLFQSMSGDEPNSKIPLC